MASNKPVYLTTKRPEIGIVQSIQKAAYLQAMCFTGKELSPRRQWRGLLWVGEGEARPLDVELRMKKGIKKAEELHGV